MAKLIFNSLCLLCITLISTSVKAYSSAEIETFENEPPRVKALLERASVLISNGQTVDASWQAANLYCEAARIGSAEGVYRLGMLYAFGHGVPANQDYAANLFSIASAHGHFEAQKMLETIEVKTDQSPVCILEAVAPEKQTETQLALSTDSKANIDQLIVNLPKNKRWVIDLVEKISMWYKVDPKLVMTIISVESNFVTKAESNKQAQGLMQLIPDTAERFNVKNAFDASQNIKGGVAYLRWLLSYFKGDVALAVAGYNAGEGAVNKYKGIPPYNETQQYVKKVQARYPFKTHPYDASIANPSPVFKSGLNKRTI